MSRAMNSKSGSQTKSTTLPPPFSLSQPGILQRKCDCGGVSGLTGQCEECNSKRLSGQERATNPPPPGGDEVSQMNTLTSTQQLPGHSFGQMSVQTKLGIGQPGDKYEQEADRVASQVVEQINAPATAQSTERQSVQHQEVQEEELQTKPSISDLQRSQLSPEVQREVKLEEEDIQAKSILQRGLAGGEASTDLESAINSARGRGHPLDAGLQQSMGQAMGADLSAVKIHTDIQADQLNRSIQAKAFTTGQDVFFRQGEYKPGSRGGQELIAHELTHVVQQGSAKNHRPAQLPIQKNSGHHIMRSLALDSTVKICHRVLTSSNIKVSQGGLRVVLRLNQLDTGVPNCQNHQFWVTLTKYVDWGFDNEIATCKGETGGTRSFSFGNLSSGTYYLTVHRVFDHPYCCIEGDILVFDEPISGESSGCVRDQDPSTMDIVHGALDIAGFIPVLGAIPDGINAAIYVVEGDWTNAGLSAVAMVPAWGDGVKLGAIAGKNAIKISEKAAIKLGEEGIAKGLKEVKAASQTVHAAEDTGKAAKLAKEAAEKLEKEAAEKALKKKIAECEGIHAAYKALGNCPSCKTSDTKKERAAKIACLTALLAGRKKYLQEKCDYVLAGSIARGSAIAEQGHKIQADQIAKMLLKCSTLGTS